VSKKKTFHARGGSDGSLDAKKQLEEDGMEELAAKKIERINHGLFSYTLATNTM